MPIVILLLVFSGLVLLGGSYRHYRIKVPTPYDLQVDEYTHTRATRPGAMRYLDKQGKRVRPHERLFVWYDMCTLNRLGCEYELTYFWQEGEMTREIIKTPEFLKKVEEYQRMHRVTFDGNEGEAEVDEELKLLIPFTFCHISFLPKVSA